MLQGKTSIRGLVPEQIFECSMLNIQQQMLAGMTATVTCFPLDLVRTRLLSSSVYSNPFGALRDVACKEGISALYVGCLPAVIGMVGNICSL